MRFWYSYGLFRAYHNGVVKSLFKAILLSRRKYKVHLMPEYWV